MGPKFEHAEIRNEKLKRNGEAHNMSREQRKMRDIGRSMRWSTRKGGQDC